MLQRQFQLQHRMKGLHTLRPATATISTMQLVTVSGMNILILTNTDTFNMRDVRILCCNMSILSELQSETSEGNPNPFLAL
jgi:hypothetical protein